jgi:hypothetical protein
MKRLFIAAASALSLLMPAIPAMATDQPTDVSEADQAAALQKMQDQLKKMQEEMAQIHKTQDPAKRRALMQEHWKSMMQGLQMMNQWGGPMMGMMGTGGMHGHMMMMNPEMMQNRMDMMQLMMDQMMQHQQMMQQPSK